MFTDYINLITRQRGFLGFGFLLAFCSSGGQTYFIGVFGPEIRQAFSLSHTEWGSIYMIGTICSAFLLPFSGQLLDRVDLRLYTAVVMTGLAIACIQISLTSSSVVLVFAIFLLRHFGQGLTSHTAMTTIARHMGNNRGKAIALCAMGYSVGEATLPLLAVMAIASFGWRETWWITAIGVMVLMLLAQWLLAGVFKNTQKANSERTRQENTAKNVEGITRKQMLCTGQFYLLLPAVLAPSYIGTAMFFHHITLAQHKGWSELWVTGNYWLYAFFAVIASLTTGPLIDRFTAIRVIPLYLTPMMAGLLVLVFADNATWVMLYMVLIGINTGIYFTTFTAIWAELYGSRYLGEIKSFVNALGVFASALGPVSIGYLLDRGFEFETICWLFALFCLISTVLLVIGLRCRSDIGSSTSFQ